MRMTRAFLLAALLARPAAAETELFESGQARVALVELYSSEGCSSCLRADRWMSDLRARAGLFAEFVPVVFHVDYWDRLGWKDALASRKYTDRQWAYARSWRQGNVYTPGMVLNGGEWLTWKRAQQPAGFTEKRVGRLVALRDVEGAWVVAFEPEGPGTDWQVHGTLLGFGIERRIRAGENRGRTLTHDFTALGLRSAAMEPSAGRWEAVLDLKNDTGVAPVERGVAFWVTRGDSLEPVQSVGGLLDQPKPEPKEPAPPPEAPAKKEPGPAEKREAGLLGIWGSVVRRDGNRLEFLSDGKVVASLVDAAGAEFRLSGYSSRAGVFVVDAREPVGLSLRLVEEKTGTVRPIARTDVAWSPDAQRLVAYSSSGFEVWESTGGAFRSVHTDKGGVAEVRWNGPLEFETKGMAGVEICAFETLWVCRGPGEAEEEEPLPDPTTPAQPADAEPALEDLPGMSPPSDQLPLPTYSIDDGDEDPEADEAEAEPQVEETDAAFDEE